MIDKKIGIIGFGNMGEAIAARLRSRMSKPGKLLMVADVDKAKLKKARDRYKVLVADSNKKLASFSDVLIIAVKPKDFEALLREIAPFLSKAKFVISIAAGITTRYIEKRLGKVAVVRAMPNMPAVIGEAISSISGGSFATKADMKMARDIFSSIGEVVEVDEKFVDSVTAVSGSGPAYFFYLMESLIEAAMALGIDEAKAKTLVFKTALGGAKLAEALGLHPGNLRAKVTSKGGTTEAALGVLESEGFKAMVKRAVTAARDRSRELSKS